MQGGERFEGDGSSGRPRLRRGSVGLTRGNFEEKEGRGRWLCRGGAICRGLWVGMLVVVWVLWWWWLGRGGFELLGDRWRWAVEEASWSWLDQCLWLDWSLMYQEDCC